MTYEIKALGWDKKITKVIGFDARGFIYGPLIAREIGCGFVNLKANLDNAAKERKATW